MDLKDRASHLFLNLRIFLKSGYLLLELVRHSIDGGEQILFDNPTGVIAASVGILFRITQHLRTFQILNSFKFVPDERSDQ